MIYIYSSTMQRIGVLEGYSSLIWTERYKELGDCEVYAPVTAEILEWAQINNFLYDTETQKVCVIKSVEIKTDAEAGDYIIVKGIDSKALLFQRVAIDYITSLGLSNILPRIIRYSFGTMAESNRQMLNHNGANLLMVKYTDVLGAAPYSGKIQYINVGELFNYAAGANGIGYNLKLNTQTDQIEIIFTKPETRQDVIFSEELDNLVESDYIDDSAEIKNCLVVAGYADDKLKKWVYMGDGQEGLERSESLVDDDIPEVMTKSELTEAFPNSTTYVASSGTEFEATIYIPYIDDEQADYLMSRYLGTIVTINGQNYIELRNVWIGHSPDVPATDDSEFTLYPLGYDYFLFSKGWDTYTENNRHKISFNARVILTEAFKYNQDFFLGDKVKVKNGYGVEAFLTVSEVLQSEDENGKITEITLTGE